MIPPANSIVSDVADEPGAAMLCDAKRRLLRRQVANWLAPLIGIPVLTVLSLFAGLNGMGACGLAVLFMGAIGYCAYLHALLNCRRRGKDPETQQARMIRDAAGYFILETILVFVVAYLPLAYIALRGS